MTNLITQKMAKTLIKVATLDDAKMASEKPSRIFFNKMGASATDGSMLINYQLDLPALGENNVYIDAPTLRGLSANGDVAIDGSYLRGANGYSYLHNSDEDGKHCKMLRVLQSLLTDWQLATYHVDSLGDIIKNKSLNGSKRIHVVAENEELSYAIENAADGHIYDPRLCKTLYKSAIKQQGHMIFRTAYVRVLLSCGAVYGKVTHQDLMLWRKQNSALCGIGIMGVGYIAVVPTIIDLHINKDKLLNF